MKLLICLILLSTFSFLSAFSQSSVWKIKGNGNEIYIGGAIHRLRDKDYPLPNEYYNAYNKSEILVTESDGSKLEDPENFKNLQKVSLYMDGRSLKNILDKEVYYELDSVCKQNELDLLRMDKYKPLMVLITLAYQANKKFGVVADGVETHLTKKAVNDSKSLLYLESFEEILNLFDKAGEGNENEFIHYLMNNIAEISKGFDEMVGTLKDGSSALIISQIEELTQNYPATYKLLVADRNKNWIPQLDSFLKTPEVEFVLVGALHLHGPDGVLQQMKNLGYKVEQL